MAGLLQPGVSIKPVVKEENVTAILKDVYGLQCVSIKELNGYDDTNYHVMVTERVDGAFVGSVCGDGYVLKVVNSLDSKKPQLFEAQNSVLLHLGKNGVCCPRPIKNKNGDYYIISSFSSGRHIVRLLEFIRGSILCQVPSSMNLFYECGRYVAKLDEALKGFHHPAYEAHRFLWMLDSIPQLTQFLFVVKDATRNKMVADVIAEFSRRVLPASQNFEKGMIHGDFNEQNVLVAQDGDGQWHVKGVLDFGDSQYNCYLYELAITMAYMMVQGRSVEVGGHVLAGYRSVRDLPDDECNLLKLCICARLCQSVVMGAYSSLQDPTNSYLLTTAKPGWTLLEELWSIPENLLLGQWKSVCDLRSG